MKSNQESFYLAARLCKQSPLSNSSQFDDEIIAVSLEKVNWVAVSSYKQNPITDEESSEYFNQLFKICKSPTVNFFNLFKVLNLTLAM